MNRSTAKRIGALEDVSARREPCMTCRFWNGSVVCDEDGRQSRPECCPDCGRRVPIWHELLLVGISLDDL